MSPISPTISAGLHTVLTAIEARVAGLTPRALPAALRTLAGAHAATPLRLDTRRWSGAGFRSLTVATIRRADDQLASVTIIGLPAPGQLAPILGVDLIGLGGALSLVAVDLAPTDRAAWTGHAEALLTDLHAALGERVVVRRRPDFADEVFSPRALIAGVRRGAELEVLETIAHFVTRATVHPPTPAAPERHAAAGERVAAWCRAELRNRREHDALSRLFGAPAADAYLDMLFGAAAAS